MRRQLMTGTPSAMGAAHGTAHRDQIVAYTHDRVARSADGTSFDRAQILSLAEECLPAHQAYAPLLYDEMLALADAVELSPAELLIAGGYTDFIDLVRARAGQASVEDNCTAVLVPNDRTINGGFLAQTWDMHASATQRVIMLDVRPDSGPSALVFSTVGCLGQLGLNDQGIAIGINNLTAADGQVGVTWPFVVRAALAQSTFDDALACITDAPLAGGHSFLLLDGNGRGAVVEAMPTFTDVTPLDGEVIGHTNHCILPGAQNVEGPRPDALGASSHQRLSDALEMLAEGAIDEDRLMALTADETSICRHPEPPFDYETCGAAVIRPATGDVWACWGPPSENDYELLTITEVTQ